MSKAELPALSNAEIARYSRHLILPEVGMEGQQRLKAASVLCIGAGGLGSPLLLYLAAAGVGRIGIVDFDEVDVSNLQRQVLHGSSSVGSSKIASARARLAELNPHVQVDSYEEPLSSENALDIIAGYDVVVDGTDNFPTRYLVNDACVLLGKPNVYGSIFRFEGQASVFNYQDGPCYRCLYEEPPPPGLVPSCAEGGVLGILPGLIGVVQATEAVKIILGRGTSLSGRLMLYDALDMDFRQLKLSRNPSCVICSEGAPQKDLIDYVQFCGVPHQEAPEQQHFEEISVQEAARRQSEGWAPFVLDVRKPSEAAIVSLGADLLIPHEEVGERLNEIPRDRDVLVHCKLGGRSATAAQVLGRAGYDRVFNLAGGIVAWATEIDSSLPTY
ncbi:MAG: molybdenum cofactor biosynthesis protein MoeB [Rickettsiales bacterium]|nr:molybdenum cofactor biosynthesis protein MoeB [Rickettsiales bacterium]|tara:strand:+ start:1492 stop:2652 length:1161 start_codon:yes stop_codon:yes gene_type:complete